MQENRQIFCKNRKACRTSLPLVDLPKRRMRRQIQTVRLIGGWGKWKILQNNITIMYFLEFWLVGFLRICVDLAVFQPYLNLEAGDNPSLKNQVAKPGIEPRSSCSASQYSLTTRPPLLPCTF